MENEKKNIRYIFFLVYLPVAGRNEKKIMKNEKKMQTEWATAHFNMGIVSQYMNCIVTARGG